MCSLIEPVYPRPGNGRPPIGLERMLRIHFLQHRFNLSDPAVEEALARFGVPELFNADQGSRFTCAAFIGVLIGAGVRLSMDGRGRGMDSMFIERLWRSLKYEDIYLRGYADGREAKAGIAAWVAFHNGRRPHQGSAIAR